MGLMEFSCEPVLISITAPLYFISAHANLLALFPLEGGGLVSTYVIKLALVQ